MTSARRVLVAALCAAHVFGLAAVARAQAPLRKIGEMRLPLIGLTAAPVPVNPAVPKDTPTALRIAVRGGAGDLGLNDVVGLLGPEFEIRGELAGPGLATTVALTQPAPGSSLLLPLPALTTAGTYAISNLRIVSGGQTLLDVTPSHVDLQVLAQVLITSVVTRPLTLQEIKDKGIVLEKDDVIGFDFTLALRLESTPVQVTFPVVFDRQGVPMPTGITPPALIEREGVSVPMIVPMMLSVEDGGAMLPKPTLRLPNGREVEVKIPALLVIPGNTGFLKQFFSAQLYVQNGAPAGTNLVVRNITGTIALPNGADAVAHTADDPLSLPATKNGPQLLTQPVRGLGPDGAAGTPDDVVALAAGETGQVEFLLRGDQEGFHAIGFDINATLDGLATGSIPVKGHANGGVLVRNPFFDVTFTAPSVVRTGEKFALNMTLTNIGQGAANALTVALDASRMSGTHSFGSASQSIDSIAPGESKTVKFTFVSDRTGQVVAHYLRFDPLGAEATGQVNFTVGVGERGVPLSPDTLVLPAVVDNLPTDVVDAAMRVLGQGWSVANAPAGTLPTTVIRTTKTGVTHKALALAEAGLRISLGQPVGDALRDFGLDFYGGDPLDNGFDQLLRQTEAGRSFALTLGAALEPSVDQAGGGLAWHRGMSDIAASGPDLVTFAMAGSGGAPPADLTLTDGSGRRATPTIDPEAGGDGSGDIRSAAFLPLGAPGFSPLAGFVTAPTSSPYTLSWTGGSGGSIDLSVSLPRGDGTTVHGTIAGALVAPATRVRVVIDTARADSLTLDEDTDGDGVFETSLPLTLETLMPSGPRALAAAVIGPETISAAQPFGFNIAVLFDRATDAASASNPANFTIPSNSVLGPHRQLSGRLVFASLARPEGPYVPTTVAISGIADHRGVVGPAATLPLISRLVDPGAVIRGRVIAADGRPVSSGVVTYLGNWDYTLCEMVDPKPFSAIPLGVDGRFEFRYVRQDNCGAGWIISANDPVTGALRQVTGRVQARGEQIEADIVLFGRGNVTGIVRDLLNRPVPGATVVAVSATDYQSGGQATTDGNGRYTIYGLTVGAVNVRAAKGISGGRTTGSVPRAGDTGTANLTLDGGTVNVSGVVRKIDGAITSLLPGAYVVYFLRESNTAVGVTQTKADGSYAIPQLPVGAFWIESFADSRSRGSVEGIAAAGDSLVEDIAIVMETGVTVRGRVVMPDSSPATNTVVSVEGRAVLTEPDGGFVIPGVSVRPYPQTVQARSRDGLRTGQSTVVINNAADVVPDVLIALSGVGSVDFLVVDPLGTPIAGQVVAIMGACGQSCGCALKIGVTDASGRVRFDGLPVGSIRASASRLTQGRGDEAVTTTSIPSDGAVAFAVLRFPGFGTVTGTVLGPGGVPTDGADVFLSSNAYDGSQCGIRYGPSQSVRTDAAGRFRFTGVNIGLVGVTVTHPFFNTSVGASDTLTANGQQVDLTLRLVDTIAGQLSGTIFLPDGTTAVGAGVKVSVTGQLPEVTVVTDAQGFYRFAKIFPEGGYRITARDPVTGGIGFEDIYLNRGRDADHPVRMKGQGTVRVHVVDGADRPVGSAFVTLRETGYPSRVFEASLNASNEGVATFEHVFEGSFSLTVTDMFGRGARPSAVLPGPGQTIDVKARLTTTGTIRGHFIARDHVTPVPFGVIQLTSYWGYGVIGNTTAAGSGDVGSFEFTHAPAGAIRISAQDPLTGRTGLGVGELTTEGEVVDIEVFAQGIGTVHGVVTSNGAPQSGAHVTVVAGRYSAGTMTDADGVYFVGGVPEGPVTATASLGTSFLQGVAAATLAGDGTDLGIDVALRDSGSINGMPVEADGTTPGPITVVTAQSGGFGGGTQSVTTDISGAFHFARVPSGLATLIADVVGSIDQGSLTVDVPAAATVPVMLTLNGTGSIDGIALDSSGQPVSGTIVITGTGAARYSLYATSAIDGTFHLTEVLAGPFTASLRVAIGFALYGNASGTVTPNEATALTIQLQDTGTVTGLIMRPDGTTPAIGAGITIQLDQSRGDIHVQTRADGRFTAVGVPLGGLSVTVFDQGSAGVGRALGLRIDANGDTSDVGTIVLDGRPFSVVSLTPPDGTNPLPADAPVTIVLSAPVYWAAGIHQLDEESRWMYFGWSFSDDGKSVFVSPNGRPDNRDLAVEVTPVLQDVYGRHLLQTVTTHFHSADTTPPHVVSLAPADGAKQVLGSTKVTVTFNEPLLPTANMQALITVTGPNGPVVGTTALSAPNVAVFTPHSDLPDGTPYQVTVNGSVDLSGNVQTVAASSRFTTSDTTPPTFQLLTNGWQGAIRFTLSFGASDDVAVDLSSFTATLDGHPLAVKSAYQSFFGSTIEATTTVDAPEGDHALVASVADLVGNRTTVTATITVVLPQAGTIQGRLFAPDHVLPVAGGDITLFADAGTPPQVAVTGADGSFRFDNLPLGWYSLQATAGYVVQAKQGSLYLGHNGDVLNVDLVTIARGSVTVNVFNPNGSPANQTYMITLHSLNPVVGSFRDVWPASGNTWTFTDVPAGDFTIAASDSVHLYRGDASGSIVQEGQTITIDLHMAGNGIGLPAALFDANNFRFSIQPNGSVSGTNNAFGTNQTGLLMDVVAGGVTTRFSGASSATVEQNRRQVVVSQAGAIAGLAMTRKIFVPEDGYFARYLEILSNPTASPITVELRVTSTVRSPNAQRVVVTSSGDGTASVSDPANPDRWLVSSDTQTSDPALQFAGPALAFVFDGPGASDRADTLTFTGAPTAQGQFVYQWSSVTVPPGGQVAYLHFAAQQMDGASAQASAQRLVQLPPEALAGLSASDIAAIRNFAVPAGGVSAIAPLKLAGRITGRVYGGDSITPVPSATVKVKSASPFYGRTYSMTAATDGAFSLNQATGSAAAINVVVPIDGFTVQGTSVGFSSPIVTGAFSAGQTVTVADVAFTNMGLLRGAVRRHTGAVAAGATTIYTAQGVSGGGVGIVTLGSSNTFVLPVFPPGTYTLDAYNTPSPGASLHGQSTGSVAAGQAVLADVVLPPTGSVSGTATVVGGAVSAFPNVTLTAAGMTRTTQGDASGHFVLIDVLTGTYTLTAKQFSTNIPADSAQISVATDQATVNDVVFPGNGTVTGTVTFATGAIAKNVQVDLSGTGIPSTQRFTDNSGRYTFTQVPTGRLFTVRATSPSNYQLHRDATGTLTTDGQSLTVNLVLPAIASVRVTVVKPAGAVVASSNVTLTDALGARSYGTTNSSGTATFANVPEGPFTVSADDPQRLRAPAVTTGAVALLDQGGTVPIQVVLPFVGSVQGHVYAGDGQTPLPNAYVRAVDASNYGYAETTDGNGLYVLPNVSLAGNAFTVNVLSPWTYEIVATRSLVMTSDGQALTADFTVPIAAVHGAVTFADGRPVADPSVSVTQPDANGYPQGRTVYTDAAGHYTSLGLSAGDFTVTAQDYNSGLAATVTGHLDDVTVGATANLSLPPSGNVTGVLRDAANNPLPNASVQLVSSGLGYQRNTSTDDQGAYRVDDVAVGRVTVQAFVYPFTATGHGELTATGRTIAIDLALPQTGTLSGTVRDAAGAPAAGLYVFVDDELATSYNVAATDSVGAYTVEWVTGPARASAVNFGDLTHAGFADTTIVAAGSATADVTLGNAAYAYSQLPMTSSGGLVYRFWCNGSLLAGGTADGRLASPYQYFAYRMTIGGTAPPCRISLPIELGGQQIVAGPVIADVLSVTRKAFVPASGTFTRYVDSFTNPTSAAVTVDVEVVADLKAAAAVRVVVAPTATSFFAVTDRSDAVAEPVLAHVFGGSGAPTTPSASHFVTADGHISYRWPVTIPAGQTVSVMHFAVQRDAGDQSGATADAQSLSALTDPNALVGLSAVERARIVNFHVPQP